MINYIEEQYPSAQVTRSQFWLAMVDSGDILSTLLQFCCKIFIMHCTYLWVGCIRVQQFRRGQQPSPVWALDEIRRATLKLKSVKNKNMLMKLA